MNSLYTLYCGRTIAIKRDPAIAVASSPIATKATPRPYTGLLLRVPRHRRNATLDDMHLSPRRPLSTTSAREMSGLLICFDCTQTGIARSIRVRLGASGQNIVVVSGLVVIRRLASLSRLPSLIGRDREQRHVSKTKVSRIWNLWGQVGSNPM